MPRRPSGPAGDRTKPTPSLLLSMRAVISLMSFFGYVNLYAQRVNLSVAMVCMVNHTAIAAAQTEANDGETVRVSACGDQTNKTSAEDGEFVWQKSIQGMALGSFFWGYITTQIAGSWLALKFGGKRVYGFSMLTCSIFTLLIPVASRLHYALLIVLRIFIGICQGVVWPAGHTVFSRWTPPLEKSRLLGFAFAGAQVGNIITLPIGGLLCRYGFAGGWPSIFYVQGMMGIVWFILWYIFVTDSPRTNRFVSEKEREYIEECTQTNVTEEKTTKVPWRGMLTSLPVWALIMSHTCSNWGNYFFLTQFPTYLKEVTGFDVKTNGATSALPYIGYYLMVLLSASIADQLKRRRLFSTTNSRKLFNSLGQLTPAFFTLIITFLDCSQRIVAVVLLVIGMSFMGNNHGSGYLVNPADIAPQFAGVIFGISNTAATIPGMIGPSIVAAMTPKRTRTEWNHVFYLTTAIYTVGAVFYLIFGSGDMQDWARVNEGRKSEEAESANLGETGNDEKLKDMEEEKKEPVSLPERQDGERVARL